jgi:putative transcriptional regulator
MQVKKEPITAIPADPDDPDDFAVSDAGVERGLMGRRIRKLRQRLGLSQAEFAARYGIPLANIRQYEIGRTLPPLAVQSYLKVIEAQPDLAAAALEHAA